MELVQALPQRHRTMTCFCYSSFRASKTSPIYIEHNSQNHIAPSSSALLTRTEETKRKKKEIRGLLTFFLFLWCDLLSSWKIVADMSTTISKDILCPRTNISLRWNSNNIQHTHSSPFFSKNFFSFGNLRSPFFSKNSSSKKMLKSYVKNHTFICLLV